MSDIRNSSESFIELEALEKISQRVEKMPGWKKEGWAILEEKSYHCGSIQESLNNRQNANSSLDTDKSLNL